MKLFSKIATLSVGLTLAIGMGIASIAKKQNFKAVNAASASITIDDLSGTSDIWSWTSGKDSGTQNPQMNSGELRLYPSGSNYLTISTSSPDVKQIDSITLSVKVNAKDSVVPTSVTIGNGTTDYTASTSTTSIVGTVTESNAKSVKFSVTGGKGNVQVASATVSYTPETAPASYTITYNANGGSGTMEPTTNVVAACTFTAPLEKQFAEWNTADDGSGTTYAVGAYVPSDITLYAIWENIPHCVTLDAIGTGLGNSVNTTMATTDVVDGDDTYTLNYLQCKYQTTNAMFMAKSAGAFISNHTEIPHEITSVELFINSGASGSATYDVAFGTSEFTEETSGIGAVNIAAGGSHEFECDVTGATFFCITLGANYNGQVLKIVVNYKVSQKASAIENNVHSEGPFEIYAGGSVMYFMFYDATGAYHERIYDDISWEVSDPTVLDLQVNSTDCSVAGLKVGNATLSAIAPGYAKSTVTISVVNDPSLDNLYICQLQSGVDPSYNTSFTLAYSSSANMYRFGAGAGDEIEYRTLVSAIAWESSDPTVADITSTSDGTAYITCYKPGTTTLKASHSAGTRLYNDAFATLTIDAGWLEDISVSGSMTKTTYDATESWNPAGLVVTAEYHWGWEEDVTSLVTWTYSPAKPAVSVTSVVATATYNDGTDDYSASSAAQLVTVTRTNPIKELYLQEQLYEFDVRGIYVGFLDGTGPVIMDGEYGIVCFAKNQDVTSYTVGETVLHVTGTLTIYNGLYELGGKVGSTYYNPTISVETDPTEIAKIEAPVVYAAKGGETQDYESRLTTVTGVPSIYPDGDKYGDFDSDAGTNDIRMTFTLSPTKSVTVFYKKAAQTADAECYAAMKAAVEGSDEITVKGFTGWYNGFQVQMNGYVPPVVGYTAEDFAQDLLDQTDAVCAEYVSDESRFNTIKAELQAIWSNLAGEGKYPSLANDQKEILADADADESGTVVEQAMARYDFLTAKYGLSQFINGRTISSNSVIRFSATNNIMLVVIISSFVVASSIGLCIIVMKKRKHN